MKEINMLVSKQNLNLNKRKRIKMDSSIVKNFRLESIIKDMKKCMQNNHQSVWDHGVSVHYHVEKLIELLTNSSVENKDFVLPEWFLKYRSEILSSLVDNDSLMCYAVYHDCGKPYCLEIDAEGKRHFPNHAIVSRNTWLSIYPERHEIADLIAHDMDIHLLKSEEVSDFCKNKNAASLLLVGLAELHSNAAMFGGKEGIESISFKIKWKQIDKRGKAICLKLFGEKL